MSRLLRHLLILSLVGGLSLRVFGFSLVGPLATWMTPRLGYNLNAPFAGGPMELTEEYRMNVPTWYYGFTADFLFFFGTRGVAEVDKAFKILNDLPATPNINIDNYPFSVQRMNHRAAALGLYDLKSTALSLVLTEMGITDPTRFVYTLRSRWVIDNVVYYYIVRRNYDPVTWKESSYINGILWTYPLVADVSPSESFVFTEPVDPLALFGFLHAPVTSGEGNGYLNFGGFWTGLSRDDVAGLKYLYRRDNYNVENAPTNAIGNFGGVWGPPPGSTNVAGTNLFVSAAVRGGLDKIKFQKVNYDSQIGFFVPFTNSWTDRYITNGSSYSQTIGRPVVAPDILFDVADLHGGDASDTITRLGTVLQAWSNNDAINGLAGRLGPGVIDPGNAGPALLVTFNSNTEFYFNSDAGFSSEWTGAIAGFRWGSFDGTTNEPVVYPIGTDLVDLERLIVGKQPGSPFQPPPNTGTDLGTGVDTGVGTIQ